MHAEYRKQAKENLDALEIFRGMEVFYKEHGIQFCGIPATIDNDIAGTSYCLGVDTSLNIIRIAIDAIRDTASSFGRAFVIETMGRECGYLALVSALTSGAELCLIPEVPYDLKHYEKRFKDEIANGRKYFLIIVSEGIKEDSKDIVKWCEEKVGIEARLTILGHIQRGGNPTVYDRLMAYKFVSHAIDGLLKGHKDSVVCYNDGGFSYKAIEEVALQKYTLDVELLSHLKELQ